MPGPVPFLGSRPVLLVHAISGHRYAKIRHTRHIELSVLPGYDVAQRRPDGPLIIQTGMHCPKAVHACSIGRASFGLASYPCLFGCPPKSWLLILAARRPHFCDPRETSRASNLSSADSTPISVHYDHRGMRSPRPRIRFPGYSTDCLPHGDLRILTECST